MLLILIVLLMEADGKRFLRKPIISFITLLPSMRAFTSQFATTPIIRDTSAGNSGKGGC